MVRVSNPISSRLVLALRHAALWAIPVSILVWLTGAPDPWRLIDLNPSVSQSWSVYDTLGLLPYKYALFVLLISPFTYIYTLKTLPKRILFNDNGLVAYFFSTQKSYAYNEVKEISFLERNIGNPFLRIRIGKQILKFEVSEGQIRGIHKYIPLTGGVPRIKRKSTRPDKRRAEKLLRKTPTPQRPHKHRTRLKPRKKKTPLRPEAHPDLKYNGYATMWYFYSGFCIFMGLTIMGSGEIRQRNNGGEALQGPVVPYIGAFFIIVGFYMIYRLLHKAKESEAAKTNFHKLEEFDDILNNYPVSFRINNSYRHIGHRNEMIEVFSFNLKVSLKSISSFTFQAKRRDRFAVFLWYLGPARIRDIITGNTYFDSRYRLSSPKRNDVLSIFDRVLLETIEKFDKDYPPIRTKNGWLEISNREIIYKEGPYPKHEYLFKDHRGQLDPIIVELTDLASQLDKRATAQAAR